MDPIIRERLMQFISDQSAESFLLLRSAVVASPAYNPYADDLQQALEAVERDPTRTRELLRSGVDNWVLSPRFHELLAYAHHLAGDEHAVDVEMDLTRAVLTGILSTGTGDADHPYLVTSPADEYDVLRHLGKESAIQSLARQDGRAYDRHNLTDGTTLWFDVTEPLQTWIVSCTSRPRRASGSGGRSDADQAARKLMPRPAKLRC